MAIDLLVASRLHKRNTRARGSRRFPAEDHAIVEIETFDC